MTARRVAALLLVALFAAQDAAAQEKLPGCDPGLYGAGCPTLGSPGLEPVQPRAVATRELELLPIGDAHSIDGAPGVAEDVALLVGRHVIFGARGAFQDDAHLQAASRLPLERRALVERDGWGTGLRANQLQEHAYLPFYLSAGADHPAGLSAVNFSTTDGQEPVDVEVVEGPESAHNNAESAQRVIPDDGVESEARDSEERPSRLQAALLCDLRRGEDDEEAKCYPAMGAALVSQEYRRGWLSFVGVMSEDRLGVGGAWTPRGLVKLSVGLVLVAPYSFDTGVDAGEWRVAVGVTAGVR